jgi:rare lipoprotein A
MYVPATSAQPAAPAVPLIGIELIADGVVSGAEAPAGAASSTEAGGLAAGLDTTPVALVKPAHTRIVVRHSDLNVLADHPSAVSGVLEPGLSGQVVTLQVLSVRGWRALAGTHTGRDGHFRIRYTPHDTGSERVRLRYAGDTTALGSHRPLGQLNSYRLAEASWYGGGGTLACGGELTSATLGVANKTLPCGTMVTLRYSGHTVRVPVVDRGPYVAGREFDLTEATKDALGFAGTGEVWSTR